MVQAGHVIPDKIRYSTGMGGGVLNYMLKHKVMTLHLQRVGVSFDAKKIYFLLNFLFFLFVLIQKYSSMLL